MSCLNDPDYTDRLCKLVLTRHQKQRDAAHNTLWRAVVLSPTAQVCDALLNREAVPRSALDQRWARRFGL